MGSSGNLEIGCLETEIIYASLLAQYFVQAIHFPHGLVMLIINACDVDLIAVMGNTVNDCISQRACFSPKLIVPFIEYILRTENKFTLPHCRVFLSSLHCFPLARKKRDTGQLSLQIKKAHQRTK